MAGLKRNKQRKAFHPLPPPPAAPVDDELMDDLFAQLDSRDEATQTHSTPVTHQGQPDQHPKQDPKGRFKARQARKAAALEESYPAADFGAEAKWEKEAKEEEQDINRICQELALQIHEVNPDGHCLFSAIADQLALLGIVHPSQANYAAVRQVASRYIFSHPDDFLPFLPPPPGENGLMTPSRFESYCVAIRDTAEWGGEPEILALSRAYKVPIHVIQGGRQPIVVHDPHDPPARNVNGNLIMRISYHRRMYGLGEHYNSLRPKSTFSQLSQKMHSILSI